MGKELSGLFISDLYMFRNDGVVRMSNRVGDIRGQTWLPLAKEMDGGGVMQPGV